MVKSLRTLLITLLIIGCNEYEREEIAPIEPSIKVRSIKNPLQDEDFVRLLSRINSNNTKGRALENLYDRVNMSNAVRVTNEFDSTIRYTLQFENEINIAFSNIVFKSYTKGESFYIINYEPSLETLLDTTKTDFLDRYSGKINFFDEQQNELLSLKFKSGELIKIGSENSSNGRTECEGGGSGGGGNWLVGSDNGGPIGGLSGGGSNTICWTDYWRENGVLKSKRRCVTYRHCTTRECDQPEYDLGCDDGGNSGPIGIIPSIDLLRAALNLTDSESKWLDDNSYMKSQIESFLIENRYSEASLLFVKSAIDALRNGLSVDFEGAYIESPTPDDLFSYQGPKSTIPSELNLSDGSKILVNFETFTSDGKSSNQPVANHLIDGLKFSLEEANMNLSSSQKIISINIYATTNGKHGPQSNHANGTAIDINKINGIRMAVSGLTNQIKELQIAMDKYPKVRENYGPYFKHKYSKETNTWEYDKQGISPHKDHIHFTTR